MRNLSVLNIDLNLLVAFEALVIEGHVSRAAAKIGVSQPAMSRSLKQLREIFGDALFTRTAGGMVPTPRAIELARTIRPGLETIAQALGARMAFDAGTAKRRFVIAMPDMATHLALPRIVHRIQEVAPSIDISIVNTGNQDSISKVSNGQVEFGLGVYDYLPPGIVSANLYPMKEICITDRANSLVGDQKLTLEMFLALSHVAVSVNDDHGTPVDTTLETLGLSRRVAVRVPHFLSVPRLVAGTQMVAVVVEEMLNVTPEGNRLVRHAVPLPLEPVMAKMIWHRRSQDDLGHQWFRSEVIASAKNYSKIE